MAGEERRKASRKQSQLFVEIQDTKLNENVGRGVVVDVSQSGFAIETESDLQVNEDYICTIEIPIKIKARVMRQVVPGQLKQFGMKFMDLGFFDKQVLKKLLKGDLRTKKIS